MEDISDAPDPLETVTLLKSDFDLLQGAVTAAEQDYRALVELLRLDLPASKSPHAAMNEIVLPIIAGIIAQQVSQEHASAEIERMVRQAKARGGNEIDLGDGRKAVLAGRKRPELLAGLQPVTARDMTRRRGR